MALPPAMFIADDPGLDFLNSVATPLNEVVDWIGDGDGLLRWLDQAGLVPASVLDDMRSRAVPGELDEIAAQARRLREWFRAFVRGHKGRPLGAEALGELEPLNSLLQRDEAFGQLVRNGGGSLELRATRHWRSPDSLLLPLGEVLGQCVAREDFTHVKACEGENCTLLFADHTRSRNRRWCSMAACGNRAKQAAHRSRLNAQR